MLTAAVAAAVQVAVLWLTELPLGLRGEWAWDRIRFGPGDGAGLFLGLIAAIPAAAALVAVVFAGQARVGRGGRSEAVWPGLLAAASFWWLWAVQDAHPSTALALGKGPLVVFSPAAEGYYTLAREEADDLPAFLVGYERRMTGDVLHIGTHPPGLVALHRSLLAACRGSTGLTWSLLASRPASAVEATDLVTELAAAQRRPLTDPEAAALWAAALLAQLAAALTVVPLYVLARATASPESAWRAASLWPLVPAVAVFLPKSDLFYPLFGTTALAVWFRPEGPTWRRGAVAGVILWTGMTLSLAMLPVVAVAAGLAVLNATTTVGPPAASRRWLFAGLAAAVVAALLTACVHIAVGLDLVAVWQKSLANHAGFYREHPRSYAAWLVLNPVELSLAVGLPATAAAAWGLARDTAERRWNPALPCVGTLALLWLSGKTSGEAARLWLFLMPWLLWMTAAAWRAESGERPWRAVWAFQFVVGTATVLRVTGFDFARMAGLAD